MLLLAHARTNRRFGRALIVLVVTLAGFSPTAASALNEIRPDSSLSYTVNSLGTDDYVKEVNTPVLRASVPGSTGNILIIGTGVDRALFPTSLTIRGAGRDLVDPYGYGTLAASVVFQLLPDARITSRAVKTRDAHYHLMKLDDLAAALAEAHAQRDRYDLVLLAFPPDGALDPVAHMVGRVRYDRYGTGADMLAEALITNQKGIHGVPSDPDLRAAVMEGANAKHRDAVERYARHAPLWDDVVGALDDLDRAGVPVVIPAGDYRRESNGRIQPLSTQTIMGIAALDQVITVGATYQHNGQNRVSPTSGRGPTPALGIKPDVVAPSDVMGLLPGTSYLPWKDDSLRATLPVVSWADSGATPTTCPALDGVYRCVLQGSTMVAASVVAANLAASVSAGVPAPAERRTTNDDEILRGMTWSQAALTDAKSSTGKDTTVWEQGAGLFTGLARFDHSAAPILLERAHLGEVSWARGTSMTVPLWSGGAAPNARATIDALTGPSPTGATEMINHFDPSRVSVNARGYELRLAATDGRYQGGIYTGSLALTTARGDITELPVSLTQTMPFDFTLSYGYQELLAGRDGERVEDNSILLFAGVPRNVGMFGSAFKTLTQKATQPTGGDKTNEVFFRTARTGNSFDGTAPANQHGAGRLPNVVPGFYKFHVLSDTGTETKQERGTDESLGIRLSTFGPDTAFGPGSDLLISALPPCDGREVAGPFEDGCLNPTEDVDPNSGFCRVANGQTQVAFNIYCQPVTYAVPSSMVSRAVHLVEHDPVPTRSEWDTCAIDVPLDGTRMNLPQIEEKAAACNDPAIFPSSWSFDSGAPSCLGPEERALNPKGHAADMTATYRMAANPGLTGRNFPVAVLSYTMKIPQPNTYTTTMISLSYAVENAVVAVRYSSGIDRWPDSSTSVLVVDNPAISVLPAVKRAGTEGSTITQWAIMSSNAPTATVSLFLIPTAWVRPDLDTQKPLAKVELCDVALRVQTFGKVGYGKADAAGIQSYGAIDGGVLDQIDPTTSRIRPVHDGTTFGSVGVERESFAMALAIPKNTTRAAGPHQVQSPIGGPAHMMGVRGKNAPGDLAAGRSARDPLYGIREMSCNPTIDTSEFDYDRTRNSAVCAAWETARANSEVLTELSPEVRVNGRFYGIMPLDTDIVRAAGGTVVIDVATWDDGGAFESRWARDASGYTRTFVVSDFFDDAVPMQIDPLGGAITVRPDGHGNTMLYVDTNDAGGDSHRISSTLG